MTSLIVYFKSDPAKFIKIEGLDKSVEEVSKTYSDSFQNTGCKALVFVLKSKAYVINKDAVAMIEVVVEED